VAKFKFTKEMLINEMVEALQEGPTQDITAKPNALEKLRAAAGLNRTKNERTQP
jgi:hypothetical protein